VPRKDFNIIDALAEREADAIDRLHEIADVPRPFPRLRYEAELMDMAAALGIAPQPCRRYARRAAVRRWLAIVEAFRRGDSPRPSRWPTCPGSRAERERRRQTYRLARQAHILAAGRLPRELCIAEAARVAGLSRSGFEKVLARGAVPRCRSGPTVTVRTADVRRYLAERLAAL
jgi:hypothetical protein